METGTNLRMLTLDHLILVGAGFLPLMVGIISIMERIAFVLTRTGFKPLKGARAITIGILYVSIGLPLVWVGVHYLQGKTLPFIEQISRWVGVFWILAILGINLIGFHLLRGET